MSEEQSMGHSALAVEERLRADLARGDLALASAAPILRHLLASEDRALFSDEVVARVRGTAVHLARQLMFALAGEMNVSDRGSFADERQEELARDILEDPAFLAPAQAMAIEAQLAERLHHRFGIDPVLPPLLKELTASPDAAMAGAAMRVIAAQARFIQHQRRMELPLGELPGDLFHAAMLLLRAHAAENETAADAAARALGAAFDESERRVGQISRLVLEMHSNGIEALSVERAGVAVFATALARASDQERDVTILSLRENPAARLALALRSAGLEPRSIEQQFAYLRPGADLPDGLEAVPLERAAALLAGSRANAVY